MFASLKTDEDTGRSQEQRIALVDADPRSSLVEALTEAGYEVMSYAHPLKALEQIVDHPVKMALVAQDLPWMSGTALARAMRESYRVSEVIVLDKNMTDAVILARVKSGAPIEEEPVKSRNSRTTRRAEVVNADGRVGRRILVRTARR